KKRRAAALLALAAEARATFAAASVGGEAEVLFESRLDDGRWTGHAANHVLVAAAGHGLENAIGRVMIDAIDGEAAGRVRGTILALDRPRHAIHRALPMGPAPHQLGGMHAG
ncbi:MAG TPA: hypothetical protein VLA44_05585, partial [Clostridia bacterium]|nr:hypothetical protein [Clostridia bacterium]